MRVGSLDLYVGIEVATAGRYILHGRVDADGKPFALLTFNDQLAAGRQEAKLRIFGKLAHDLHAKSPFTLHDLEGYLFLEDAYPDRENMLDQEGVVYTTGRYADGELSDAPWESEQKQRHVREYERDIERALAEERGR